MLSDWCLKAAANGCALVSHCKVSVPNKPVIEVLSLFLRRSCARLMSPARDLGTESKEKHIFGIKPYGAEHEVSPTAHRG